jgi:hypothetical protein
MNTQTTRRATSFSLAALLTLSLLASINMLATSPAPQGLLAQTQGTSVHAQAAQRQPA